MEITKQLATGKSSILNSAEADKYRSRIAAWVGSYYANLANRPEYEYPDAVADYDPVGPDWPDDGKDDVGPKLTDGKAVFEADWFGA